MERKHLLIAFLIGLALLLALNATAPAAMAQGPTAGNRAPRTAIGTAFTYQGRLNRNNNPANGYFDFQFLLYDQLLFGTLVAGPIPKENVHVQNGIFTVLLDFGNVFDGTLLFLEVRVKDHSVLGYTTLPRHALWAKPYAIYASTAPWSGLTGVPAGFSDGVDNVGTDWSLTGNSGTTPGTNFVGTIDNQPLEFKVASTRALRLEYANNGLVNVVGGYSGNSVTSGAGAATISGGGDLSNTNRVTDYAGTVGGGTNNQAGDNASNTTNASYATVGGGNQNTASGIQATIGGGVYNTASGSNTTISGGHTNNAIGSGATIGGGAVNNANSAFTTVSGGEFNVASGESATIGGGTYNTASNYWATVSGGDHNEASGDSATIGGGRSNRANDYDATVSGGRSNTASGRHATVPGGLEASAGHVGEMAYASGKFASTGDAQTSTFVLRNTTTDATQTELFLDGNTYKIGIGGMDRTLTFDILVVARRDSSNQSAGYHLRGVIKNDDDAVAFVGAPSKTILGEDNSNWDANVEADDDNDFLRILVTGANGATIRWVATVRTAEVRW